MEFSSGEQLLEYAIEQEDKASRFYLDLAAMVERPEIREMLQSFAAEERAHKAKLESVRDGKQHLVAPGAIPDLKLAEHLTEEQPREDLNYQQALMLAMQREKEAFRLYTRLAAATVDADLRRMLQGLAAEEAGHKLRFEIEYEDTVLQDN
jgi:rubrerythrin